MQIIRTLTWVTVTAILVAFIAMNWEAAPVNIWPLEEGYLYFRWPVGVIALLFFLLGLLPMWALHRASHWRSQRRITSLENSLRATSQTPAPLIATSTQLEAAEQEKPPT